MQNPGFICGRRTLLGAALAAPMIARSQNRGVMRIVTGFAPGGGTDFVARALAREIAGPLDRAVIVENMPGAGSNLASAAVARAAPDGNTVLLGGNFSHAINPHLYRKVSYNWNDDFQPVTRLNAGPFIFVVRSDSPFKSLAELIAYAKANPGKLNYASSGNGSPQHLGGAWLAKKAGFEWVHVPYKGGAPALLAVLSGEVDLVIASVAILSGHESSGKLRVLSSSISKRWPSIPDVPSMSDNNVKDFDLFIWLGLWLPARTPDAQVQTLFTVVRNALGRESLAQAMRNERLVPSPSQSTAEFTSFVRSENALWREIVRTSGAVAD